MTTIRSSHGSGLLPSKQKGFAFVEYENREQAEDAISHLDGQRVCDSTVSVSIAKNNRKTPSEMRRLYDSRRSRSRSYRRSRSRSYHRSRRSRSYPRRSRSPSYERRRYYRSGSRGRSARRSYSRYDWIVCLKHAQCTMPSA